MLVYLTAFNLLLKKQQVTCEGAGLREELGIETPPL